MHNRTGIINLRKWQVAKTMILGVKLLTRVDTQFYEPWNALALRRNARKSIYPSIDQNRTYFSIAFRL